MDYWASVNVAFTVCTDIEIVRVFLKKTITLLFLSLMWKRKKEGGEEQLGREADICSFDWLMVINKVGS